MKKAKTYGLTHIAIAVRDLDQTLTFYQKVFEVEVMYHKDDFLQVTTPGAHDIIVFEKKKADLGSTGGIAHFGFRFRKATDIDEMARRIRSAGGTIIDQGEFVPGEPYIFLKDPDGYEVEIWYELIEE
jgi:catechol 2,3-dioxygenase-like lactoylglutathione lyase family enzyme